MDRTNTQEEYRFNEKGHVHEVLIDGGWQRVTGCTTVLGVIAKPALIQWAANEATAHAYTVGTVPGLKEEIAKYPKITTEVANAIDKLFPDWKAARCAHRKKKETAGDWGTDMHAWVEMVIRKAILEHGGFIPKEWKNQTSNKTEHFINWAIENNVRFLETEKGVYSKKHFIAGIVDIVCEMDGKLWLADIKTGSGIYAEAFWQMGGYDIMMEEMGYPKIAGYVVLNLKKDGTFDEKRSISNDDHRDAFMAALTIYRIQEKVNNNIL